MIAEPYIATSGPKAGAIEWRTNTIPEVLESGNILRRYADFEREKLKELGWRDGIGINISSSDAFWLIRHDGKRRIEYMSDELIGYGYEDFQDDSESSRLLNRAEFLKAVCEKEGVEWLPTLKGLGQRLWNTIEEEAQVHQRIPPAPSGTTLGAEGIDVMHVLTKKPCGCSCHTHGNYFNVGNSLRCETCGCDHAWPAEGTECYTKHEVDAKLKFLVDEIVESQSEAKAEGMAWRRSLLLYLSDYIDHKAIADLRSRFLK